MSHFVATSLQRFVAVRLTLFVVALAIVLPSASVRGGDSLWTEAQNREHQNSAIEFCTKALEESPENVTLYLTRARARWELADRDGAISDLAAARKLDSYLADVREAQCRMSSDEIKEAAKLLEKAIAAEPDRGEAYYERAFFHSHQRRFTRALQDLDEAIARSKPQSYEVEAAAIRKAEIYEHLGRYEEAVEAATLAIDLYFVRAIEDAKLGVFTSSLDLRYYHLRAAAYAELEDYQRAIDDLNTCVASGADWPSIFELRADYHHAAHELDLEQADRARAAKLRADESRVQLPEPRLIDPELSAPSSLSETSRAPRTDAPIRRGATNLLRNVIRR
jgi:tetratricopeptide (TPR) repeat protein